jgi:hypothetical protein
MTNENRSTANLRAAMEASISEIATKEAQHLNDYMSQVLARTGIDVDDFEFLQERFEPFSLPEGGMYRTTMTSQLVRKSKLREAYGATVAEIRAENERLRALLADIELTHKLTCGGPFFTCNCGVAEQQERIDAALGKEESDD